MVVLGVAFLVLLILALVLIESPPAHAATTARRVLGLSTTATPAPSTTRPPPAYPSVTVLRSAPVRGVVVDPWRPPADPYAAGNRGIDVAAVPGSSVLSPADGIVTFAGAVGPSRFVVIGSADGIRITLGFLASVTVRTGQSVRRGQVVGRAMESVHIGARVGNDYVDPTPLFASGPPHVRLIPVDRSKRTA